MARHAGPPPFIVFKSKDGKHNEAVAYFVERDGSPVQRGAIRIVENVDGAALETIYAVDELEDHWLEQLAKYRRKK